MNSYLYMLWTVLAILSFFIVYFLKKYLRKINKTIVTIVFLFLQAIIILILALCLIAFASPFLWHTNYFLTTLYIALLGDFFTSIIFLFIKEDKYYKYVVALITLFVFLYGTINMQTIKPNYLTYYSDKLSSDYKLVFFSDLHYGSSQSSKTVDKALEAIKKENPDYLLLGGDIVDEFTTKSEMEELFTKIGSLNIDAYYIYGNHDRQDRADYLDGPNYTPLELESTIINNGITILYNDFVKVNDDLVFLGLEDPSHPEQRIKAEDIKDLPYDSYIVCLDHNPYQNDDIIKIKADLQLSGHTHAGQLFPLKTFYSLIGLNAYGKYRIGDTDLFVSSGITGWYLPFRNEENCNYEVIELKKTS